MDIFISYSRSARDAEREFLKLYEQLGAITNAHLR